MATTSTVSNTINLNDWLKQEAMEKAAEATKLDMNSFYKLLAAQLQNQDMNNPMDNSEMMNQMSQMSMMQAVSDMSEAIESLSVSTNTSYAASMIGRTGTFAVVNSDGELEGTKTGTITSVDLTSFSFYLDGDSETGYPMSQLMGLHSIGDIVGGSGGSGGATDDEDKTGEVKDPEETGGTGGSGGVTDPEETGGTSGSGSVTDPEETGGTSGSGGVTDPEETGGTSGSGGATDPEETGGTGGSGSVTDPQETGGTGEKETDAADTTETAGQDGAAGTTEGA